MNQTKITWLRRGIAAVLAILLLVGVVLNVSAFATDNATDNQESGHAVTTSESANVDGNENTIAPTFAVDEDDDNSIRIKVGSNSLLFGNDFAVRDDIKGLAFIAGNSIKVENNTKYGFIAGNTVEVSGFIQNDLFATGNLLKIIEAAEIGGDVFAAGNELVVQTNLPGDLAFTGNTLKIEGTTIHGNVNVSVDKIVFDSNTKINGSLTYNDTATIVGLSNAEIKNVESYHVEEEERTFAREFYAKFLSMVSLFIVMLVVVFFMPRLHQEVEQSSNTQGIIIRMATGAWLLLLIPIVAIFTLCSVVGVPLSLILIVLYIIAIYLSQGFAGVWVGHLIIEKLAKSRASVYVEALVGIVVLGILTLVPYIGGLVYFLSLLLGFGTLAHYLKPRKTGGLDSSTESSDNSLNGSKTDDINNRKKSNKKPKLIAEDGQNSEGTKNDKIADSDQKINNNKSSDKTTNKE